MTAILIGLGAWLAAGVVVAVLVGVLRHGPRCRCRRLVLGLLLLATPAGANLYDFPPVCGGWWLDAQGFRFYPNLALDTFVMQGGLIAATGPGCGNRTLYPGLSCLYAGGTPDAYIAWCEGDRFYPPKNPRGTYQNPNAPRDNPAGFFGIACGAGVVMDFLIDHRSHLWPVGMYYVPPGVLTPALIAPYTVQTGVWSKTSTDWHWLQGRAVLRVLGWTANPTTPYAGVVTPTQPAGFIVAANGRRIANLGLVVSHYVEPQNQCTLTYNWTLVPWTG